MEDATTNDYASVLQVITWVMLAAMFLSVMIRLLSRRYLIHYHGVDDTLVGFVFLFALGQSLCVVVPKHPIWGKPLDTVDAEDLATGLKTQYAGTLLFYAGLALAKVSVLVSFGHIYPATWHPKKVIASYAAIAVWILVAEITIAFQCSLPEPWNIEQAHCRNRFAILLFADIGNIVTDLVLLYFPFAVIIPLQMPIRNRLLVLSLLSTRVLVVAAIIVQISFLPRAFQPDYTFKSFPYNMTLQFVQALSMVSCSVPALFPFMQSLQTGMVFTDDIKSIQGSRGNSLADSRKRSVGSLVAT